LPVDEPAALEFTAFMRLLLLLALAGAVLAGCRHSKPSEDPFASKPKKTKAEKSAAQQTTPQPLPPKPLPKVTAINEISGKVAAVNTGLRFAVLDFYLAQLPAIEQRLGVYRQGQKVGEVKISGPARDHNIVADITAGEAQVGDEVRAN
jgi:hypothetical protein